MYLSPGVYVEEVPSGNAPIAGVSTSTAGFIGVVPDDVAMPALPTGEKYRLAAAGAAQLVTSWAEFTRKFGTQDLGAVSGANALAHAVRGFFANGGSRCWVARLTSWTSPGNDDPVDAVLRELESIDEISLVAAPMVDVPADRAKVIQEAVLAHCEKQQDRVAILDGPRDVEGDVTSAKLLKTRASDYGALYFPWIDVTGGGGFAPPSGHVAGMFARVDAERGVHKAPANEALRGAYGVRYRIGKAVHDELNPAGVNVLRPFGNTVKVWGARTLADPQSAQQKEFTYINVRRLFCFLRESIEEGTGWVVFEPNTPELWARITRNVRAFLTRAWESGALFGKTPEEAFTVKCDADNNPPEVRALGQVVTEIGVAVTRPAEFVVFRLSQRIGG